jgi:hypothetical protein
MDSQNLIQRHEESAVGNFRGDDWGMVERKRWVTFAYQVSRD